MVGDADHFRPRAVPAERLIGTIQQIDRGKSRCWSELMKPSSSVLAPEVEVRKTRSQCFRDAEAAITEHDRSIQNVDRRMVQLALGIEAKWYLVALLSDAEKELPKRGFGIYVPEFRETIIWRGRRVDRRSRMFPGYVFVFFWPTGENWRRVLAIDGVRDILGGLHEEQMHLIRAVENAQAFPVKTKKARLHSKARRRGKWEDWLEQLRSLDSDTRNQALRKLLGLF